MSSAETNPVEINWDAEIGEKAHMLMWRRGITQIALGEQLGVDQSSIAKRLKGKRKWTTGEVVALARALRTTVAFLYGETSNPDGPDNGSSETPSKITFGLLANDRPDSVADLDYYRSRKAG